MRFDKAFIDSTREAQGDEAAAQLEKANADEDHRDRVAKFKTDPGISSRFPRMANALKTDQFTLPTFADDAAAEAFMTQQENLLIAAKAPLPGEDQKQQNQQQNQQNAGENHGDQSLSPEAITDEMLGQRPGMVPWDSNATQAVLRPTQPGTSPNRVTVIVAEVEDLMDPEAGKFRRGRDRDFALIKGMMIANSMMGGPQQLAQLRQRYEDSDVFEI